MLVRSLFASLIFALSSNTAWAQDHVHTPEMAAASRSSPLPSNAGQAAFAAISEIVAILSADSSTDWSTADIETLRRHLVDMDNVVLRSRVRMAPIDGGVRLVVTGSGAVAGSIRAMLLAHSAALDALPLYRASAAPVRGGSSLSVVLEDRSDQRRLARLRALGLGGILAEGSHHQAHHLMMAKGEGHH